MEHTTEHHFRPVDYDHLLSVAKATRNAGEERRKRVEGLRGKGRALREARALSRHREVWVRESVR